MGVHRIRCFVPGCLNSKSNNPEQSFHSLPANDELRRKWCTNLGKPEWAELSYARRAHMRVCGVHFHTSAFRHPKSKKLNLGAVPKFLYLPSRMSQLKCSVPGCPNTKSNSPEQTFHCLPRNDKLRREWCHKIGRPELLERTVSDHGHIRICGAHFHVSAFQNPTRAKLIRGAVPMVCCRPPDKISEELPPATVPAENAEVLAVSEAINLPGPSGLQAASHTSSSTPQRYGKTYGASSSSDVSVSSRRIDPLPECASDSPASRDSNDKIILESYCRFCASLIPAVCLIPLTDTSEGVSFIEKLKFCFSDKVKVNKDDDLPQKICRPCAANLNNCNKTLKSFIKANLKLRTLFKLKSPPDEALKSTSTVETMKKSSAIELEKQNSTVEANKKSSMVEARKQGSAEGVMQIATVKAAQQNVHMKEIKETPLATIEEPQTNFAEQQFIQRIPEQVETKENDNPNNSNVPPTRVDVKYQCFTCLKLFETKTDLAVHFVSSHPIPAERKIPCKIIKSEINENEHKRPAKRPTPVNSINVKPIAGDKTFYGISYQCLQCALFFQRKEAFIEHTRRKHRTLSQSNFACKIVKTKMSKNCKPNFRNYKLYRRHIRQLPPYKCDQCDMLFDRIYKLKLHGRLHNPVHLKCSVCNIECNTKKELRLHEFEYHNRRVYKCSTCHEVFDTRFLVRKHRRIHESCLCNKCGKLFSSLNYLERHLKTHSDVRPFSCNICFKTFKLRPSLVKHRATHINEKNFICQYCGKLFRTLEVLRQHTLIHSSFKPHVCEICGLAFYRRANLVEHRKRHEALENKTQQCKICDKALASFKALRYHIVLHSRAQNAFQCDTCKKCFISNKQLKIHTRLHTGEEPFSCDVCEKGFSSAASLRQHKLIHLDVFPHECDFCDKKFKRLQSLRIHRKTHTGERPYSCPECGHAFTTRSDMVKHRRIHIWKREFTPPQHHLTSLNRSSIGEPNPS